MILFLIKQSNFLTFKDFKKYINYRFCYLFYYLILIFRHSFILIIHHNSKYTVKHEHIIPNSYISTHVFYTLCDVCINNYLNLLK